MEAKANKSNIQDQKAATRPNQESSRKYNSRKDNSNSNDGYDYDYDV